jgi:hypothetical protein
MLSVTVFEFLVRLIPEAFVFIFASYVFSNTKLNVKRYISSSLLLGTCVYTVRMLPINYGVHTILNIAMQTVIVAYISKIDIIEGIKSAIISTIFLLIFEGINMMALNLIFKDNLESILANTILKTMYGFPSLVCFFITIAIYYLSKKDKFKYV